ncbi:hypothetical protein HIM_03781 [Hirsutella minnesotensis 3608]|uniref:Terpene synthase n=1 Tax=Hirsutella minnesotensis 3608 TaxID=1043627 RepID=A0A0F8A6D8_9HYPO|nr:hypothetical protein HIM_03781 [Hirsutella minnesotensis 3608]
MDIDQTQHILHIPETLHNWAWARVVSPHYEDCKRKSAAWVENLGAFGPKAQIAFNKCDFSLLASMAYAELDKDGCQVGCDLMNLYFIIDEWSDVSDENETRRQADAIMDALRNPYQPRPPGEWIGGEATRQFWLHAINIATESAQKRFIVAFQHYTEAVVQQSFDRTHGHIRNVQRYFEIRRETIGARPSFVINQIHDNFPDDIMQHPVIESLTLLCIDMLIIGNDLYSYNVEQSRGDDVHNLVTVVMNDFGYDVHEAFNWIGCHHHVLACYFMMDYEKVAQVAGDEPGYEKQIRKYAAALGNWVRANDQWSFEVCTRANDILEQEGFKF